MLTTYEFYVAGREGGAARFVPVLCDSDKDLVSRARELLEREDAASVEVRKLGVPVFVLVP